MTATIYFIYSNRAASPFLIDDIGVAEETIRYWLGKSPGMFRDDIVDILVIPEPKQDWMFVIDKIRQEEAEHEEKLELSRKRDEYERLKAIFEK